MPMRIVYASIAIGKLAGQFAGYAILLMFLWLGIGPIEGAAFPILANAMVTGQYREGSHRNIVCWTFSGHKVRDAQLVGMTTVVIAADGTTWPEATIDQDTKRPVGSGAEGRWSPSRYHVGDYIASPVCIMLPDAPAAQTPLLIESSLHYQARLWRVPLPWVTQQKLPSFAVT